jgi:hypothetical protein
MNVAALSARVSIVLRHAHAVSASWQWLRGREPEWSPLFCASLCLLRCAPAPLRRHRCVLAWEKRQAREETQTPSTQIVNDADGSQSSIEFTQFPFTYNGGPRCVLLLLLLRHLGAHGGVG